MEFARQTIEINGCKLSLARGGKGAPLIYLHGTDGLADWPGLLDTLAERFDVIAPDHPGFGGSEAPAWIDDNDVEALDRKSTRLNSSHANISYAVFCFKKKNKTC